MAFYALAYRVLFHDTMAYGSHHYLSNFKFQNIARETILFSDVDGQPVWKEQLADLVLLTREAYSLNLAPVSLGQRVAIFLTYEDATRSTVRLCFRIVREDGQPVSCGYQTMICMHRETQELVPAPPMVTMYLDPSRPDSLLEPLTAPSFADRLKAGAGALKAIFPDALLRLGAGIASAPDRDAYPRIVGIDGADPRAPARVEPAVATSGLVLTFAGQGSYRPAFLRELYEKWPETQAHFRDADAIVARTLGRPLLPGLFDAPDAARRTDADRDTAQVGIYLAGALTARILLDRGLAPELLIGHSVGELAALATAGVFTIADGVEIVCRRLTAIRSAGVSGGMAALSCDTDRARVLLDQAAPHGLEVSVRNHAKQTVVSGPVVDLATLQAIAPGHGVSATLVDTPFPFHSSHMRAATEPFRRSLDGMRFADARIPVFLCTEETLLSSEHDMPDVLANHLVRELHFGRIVDTVRRRGYHSFVECGGADILTKLVEKNVREGPVTALAASPSGSTTAAGIDEILLRFGPPPRVREASGAAAVRERAAMAFDPIAVVATGCVLPGAGDPDHFWRNILDGVSGIVDLAVDPDVRHDFVAGSVNDRTGQTAIVADKTYTLLNGTILNIPFPANPAGFAIGQEEFATLTRGQRLLALALGQLTRGLPARTGPPLRTCCILGSTADGAGELDTALFVDGLFEELAALDEPERNTGALGAAIEAAYGRCRDAAPFPNQRDAYRAVADKFLPGNGATFVVDSACSSSLYAVHLGVAALQRGTADLAIVGGVFAPGPANNTLFAQFRGLSPTGSRPFDATADGVIFGDGCALLALRPLSRALQDGDRVLAVLRGIGLSSDGKSPSINVPQVKGQRLAIHRALERSGVPIESVQYVEAHATATPVGDKVEVTSLCDVFSRGTASAVGLGSVKALIGHTGWASGAASLIKICKAFEHRTIPPQYNFQTADPQLELERSPFRIASAREPWPENTGGVPRRAGVNGFGFGGTNAHVILEEFEPAFHRALAAEPRPYDQEQTLAIVAAGTLFPAADALAGDRPSAERRFSRDRLRLPRKKLLLPDVSEHMDVTQYLVSLAAEGIFDRLPADAAALREHTAVVVGLEGKTERGFTINKRIFADSFLRVMAAHPSNGVPRAEMDRLARKLVDHIRQTHQPSGPYTLPGLMPNVTASRVASLFDLNGPNLVIDEGESSLWRALAVACDLLAHDDCRMVLAGGVHATHGSGAAAAETGILLAVTTIATAATLGFPVLATLRIPQAPADAPVEVGANGAGYGGATGAAELRAALDRLAAQSAPIALNRQGVGSIVLGSATEEPRRQAPRDPVAPASQTYAYVKDTPITCYTPVLQPMAPRDESSSLHVRKLLILTDQADRWRDVRRSGVLDALRFRAALPIAAAGPDDIAIDLASEEALLASLAQLDRFDYDTVLAIKFLDGAPASPLSQPDLLHQRALLDLLFAICRRDYDAIAGGRVNVTTLSLGSMEGHRPAPYTGLLGGFMKSIARELPGARLAAVSTDEANLLRGLRQLENELNRPMSDGEVCYAGGVRHVVQLAALDSLADDRRAWLDGESVVLATGGGRGVTAVLVEELLRRFECTVVAVGRTDPSIAPPHVLAMDEDACRRYETAFYEESLARQPRPSMRDLKRQFAALQAANEVTQVERHLRALPGRYAYHAADLTSAAAVDALVRSILEQYGRIDFVLHGAGVQSSGMLKKKPLGEFRKIVDAKLAVLGHVHEAIARRQRGRRVHFHLVTSAFSYLGNDGQPDYGAANEALNRIAAAEAASSGGAQWSSFAWLGWAGIGMTRGSEFAALAASRRLRGVTREEGRELFGRLLEGTPAAPINVMLAPGEVEFYRPAIAPPRARATRAPQRTLQVDWDLNLDNAPFLRDHVVNGTPTMPASFITCAVADAAKKLRPELFVAAYENTHYQRFVRVPADRGARICVRATIVSEGDEESRVHVQVLSDFLHKSGVVLQKDIVHSETVVRMVRELPVPPAHDYDEVGESLALPDPYTMPDSRVQLGGQFASTSDIRVGRSSRTARYELAAHEYPESPYRYLLPNLVCVDAFWRFGTVQVIGDHRLGVYVPERCGVMHVFFDYVAFDSPRLRGPLTFRGTNPRIENDLLHVGPIDVSDADGNVLLLVERGVCRKYGEVVGAF